MVSHSLNLFWFADVYPTVSHKNCPKKKKKLGTRVLEESLTLSINNLKNSIQGSPEATFYSHFLGFWSIPVNMP